MIGICFSKETHERIRNIRKELAKEIESKNENGVICKYNGYALISETILVRFKNGKPSIVLFNDKIVGTATIMEDCDIGDFVYPIHDQEKWYKYVARNKDFFLSIGSNYGAFGGYNYYAQVFGSTEDFTNYSTW